MSRTGDAWTFPWKPWTRPRRWGTPPWGIGACNAPRRLPWPISTRCPRGVNRGPRWRPASGPARLSYSTARPHARLSAIWLLGFEPPLPTGSSPAKVPPWPRHRRRSGTLPNWRCPPWKALPLPLLPIESSCRACPGNRLRPTARVTPP